MTDNKKRRRITKVCDFCRKRKVKCDLGNPCSSCVKYKQVVCSYGEWNENEDALTGQLQFLKEKVKKLEENIRPDVVSKFENKDGAKSNNDSHHNSGTMRDSAQFTSPFDTINFYDGYTSVIDREPLRRRHSSPLSWVALIKADNALSKLWNHMKATQQSKYDKELQSEKDEIVPNPVVEQKFRQKVTSDEGYDDVKLYKDQTPNLKPRYNLMCKAKSLGLSYYKGGLDAELELIEKIRLVCPNQKTTWMLIRRFFTHLYVYFPFVDEIRFIDQCETLIGTEDYLEQPLPFVKAEKKLDFAFLGLLLVVLRLAYLSLFTSVSQLRESDSPENAVKAETVRYLIVHPIDIDVIDVSQSCLDQFNLTRGINMAIMQLAMFLRIYRVVAPEDGEGADGGDSMVMNAMLIQMARSLGLHREPDLFPDHCNDEKTNNIGRKMWYHLCILDYTKSLNEGSVCNIRPDSFDTKPPYFTAENANCTDLKLERICCQSLHSFNLAVAPLHKLIKMVSTVKGTVNVIELNEIMNALEDFYSKEFSKLVGQIYDDDLSTEDLFIRSVGIKVYFTVSFVAVSIHFHLFNYYERRRNIEASYFYLKTFFEESVRDLMPFYFAFLERSNKLFKNLSDISVTPVFEQIIHKSLLVLTSVYIRVKFSVSQYKSYDEHEMKLRTDQKFADYFRKLNHFMKVLFKAISVFSGLIGKLANRYYYAWMVSKGHKYICGFLENSDFVETYKDSTDNTEFAFTSEMLDEIIEIIETSLSRIKELKDNRDEAQNNFPDLLSDNSMDTNNNESANPKMYKTSPVVSNSSTDSFDNVTNDEIDRMWMQLMSNKKTFDTNDWNSKLSVPDNSITSLDASKNGYYDGGFNQDIQPLGSTDINVEAGIRTLDYSKNMISDLLDGLPIDDFFQEFR